MTPDQQSPEPVKLQYWHLRNHELREFHPLSCSRQVLVSYTNLSNSFRELFILGVAKQHLSPLLLMKFLKTSRGFITPTFT